MENKYYDNTPIIEYPLIVAELKQQLKAKDELIEETIGLIRGYQDHWEDDENTSWRSLMDLFKQTEKLRKSLKGE